ncbi:MAG TPA: lysophospholipid acyltransferase family protein [Terriglobales bacterium]|nr:lysophospholipid acyltransferase family protein [Terriglobales bacterium]
MRRAPDRPWWMPLATASGALLVRLLGRSWRIELVGVAERDAEVAAGAGPCIFVFWHARLLPLVFTHRKRGIAVLISRSRDGELISGIVERMGFVTARGSSSRGASEGMLDLIRWGERGHDLAVTPDGPRGPAGQVRPGLVHLASRTGYPIIPAAAAARAATVLPSWDRFRVPRPFTRVVAGYGEPVRVPRDLDAGAVEAWRCRIEQAIETLTRAFARRVGEAP